VRAGNGRSGMSTVLLGLAFLALLVTGLAGWGSLLLGVALRQHREQLGVCAATGLCVYLGLAVLFEFGVVKTPGAITLFLTAGALVWLLRLTRRGELPTRPANGTSVGYALAIAAALTLLLLAANAASWRFANVDDLQGYLGYVERIFQTGSTGPDPFAYRRFEAGLGGGTYVYALGEPLRALSRLRIVDIGGGVAILAALLLADTGKRGAGPAAAVLLALAVAVAFAPAMNMSPDIIGMAMLYAMLRLGAWLVATSDRVSRAGLVGLFVFALICIKTTFLIPAAAVAGSVYATLWVRDRSWRLVAEAAVAGAVALLLMAPWMWISQMQAGTPLFPLLGAGRLSPLEASGFASPTDFVKSAGRLAIILALPLWVAVRRWRTEVEPAQIFVRVAAIACTAVILAAQVKFTVAGYRYGYAPAAALFLFCLAEWLKAPPERRERRIALAAAPLLVLNVALYAILRPGYGADTFRGGLFFAGASDEEGAERARVRRMQAAVPAGATLLVRIVRPFDLDFTRNQVLVMDWPGLTGPDAQPPASESPAFWRNYLRRSGIRYLAWSYGTQSGMPEAYLQEQMAQSESAFFRDQMRRTILTQRALEQLRRSQPIPFDDGQTAVIDLQAEPAESGRSRAPAIPALPANS